MERKERTIRANDPFYRQLTADQVARTISKCLGDAVTVVHYNELDGGLFNTTYKVVVAGYDTDVVVLRAAPPYGSSFSSERDLLRNELLALDVAAAAPIAIPRALGFDWSGEIVERDILVESFLPGTPVLSLVRQFPRDEWFYLFRSIGELTREIHEIKGTGFGLLAGDQFESFWKHASNLLGRVIRDCQVNGIASDDLSPFLEVCSRMTMSEGVKGAPPTSLLTGDLWLPNLLAKGSHARDVQFVGWVDLDRVSWGEPAGDWPLQIARSLEGKDSDAFWEGYGWKPPAPGSAGIKEIIYEVLHLGALRLERFRLGKHDRLAEISQRLDLLDRRARQLAA